MISDSDVIFALLVFGLIYLSYAAVFIYIIVLIFRKKTLLRIGLAVLFIVLSIFPHYYFQIQTKMRGDAVKRAAIIPKGIDFKGKSILVIDCGNPCRALKKFSGAAHVYRTSSSRFDDLLDSESVDLLPLVEDEVVFEKSEYSDDEYEISYKPVVMVRQIDFVIFNGGRRGRIPDSFMDISEHVTKSGLNSEDLEGVLVVFSVEDSRNFAADQILLALFRNTGGQSVPIPYFGFFGEKQFWVPEYDFLRSNLRPIFCPNATQEQCQNPF